LFDSVGATGVSLEQLITSIASATAMKPKVVARLILESISTSSVDARQEQNGVSAKE
jgi:hypothetical protein